MANLGGCPRIAIFSKIEEFPKKLPHRLNTLRCHYREFHRAGRHIVDIPRIIFLGMTWLRATHRHAKSLGERAFSDS